MPQLQINQGPQDALLYDNTRSYFTNVGYVRTSNFQVEYRKVDAQNNVNFGSTVQYIIPKSADLLGPVDLRVELPELEAATSSAGVIDTNANGFVAHSGTTPGTRVFTQWVDELGYAMIEKVTFSVGSNDIETITGEQLQIQNELMKSDEMRLGHGTIQKTGRAAFAKMHRVGHLQNGEYPGTLDVKAGDPGGSIVGTGAAAGALVPRQVNRDYTRLIELGDGATDGSITYEAGKRFLIVPLGLFFTKHVSQYFPLAAVAGCNDIRISIKFRPLAELVQIGGMTAAADAEVKVNLPKFKSSPTAQLMCHYVHVTGPEAQTLMNKEHVRLLKLWQHQTQDVTSISNGKIELNLSFLHPVSTLIITVRAANDMTGKVAQLTGGTNSKIYGRDSNGWVADQYDTAGKGYFFYHGDGTNPNYDRHMLEDAVGLDDSGDTDNKPQGTVRVTNLQLKLNGQERHPGLDKGLDIDYIRERLLPMLHSNSNQVQQHIYAMDESATNQALRGQQGSKNIMIYPFSLSPEGTNPSGAVNFSKVSHANLTLHLATPKSDAVASPLKLETGGLPTQIDGLRVDVYALYYNWLQIKDGRALLSFA